MIDEEALEQIKELLEELREYANEGVPIIVEGARDASALHELGVEKPVMRISGRRRTALNFLEGLSRHRRVVVLTDFDRAGDELAKFCAAHLKRLGVEPIADLREKLKVLLHKEIRDVQGLAKFLRKALRCNSRAGGSA